MIDRLIGDIRVSIIILHIYIVGLFLSDRFIISIISMIMILMWGALLLQQTNNLNKLKRNNKIRK